MRDDKTFLVRRKGMEPGASLYRAWEVDGGFKFTVNDGRVSGSVLGPWSKEEFDKTFERVQEPTTRGKRR